MRPAFRRRGYATRILERSLVLAADLGLENELVTCDDGDVGSARVIERCGGVLEDVDLQEGEVATRRYWIRPRP